MLTLDVGCTSGDEGAGYACILRYMQMLAGLPSVLVNSPHSLVLVALVTKARAQRLRLDSGIRAEDGGL